MQEKIISIDISVENIALKRAFITALRRVDSVSFVRVRLVCSKGSEAIGEAPATFAITGEDIESIVNSAELLREGLIGLRAKEAVDFVQSSSVGSSAKAMFDMAFMKLLGFFKLENSEPIKTDITISLNSKERMLLDAQDAYESGMEILKIKLGNDISHAIDVTKLLSENLQKAELLIDANQAWSREESFLYVNAINSLKLALIEQPVIASDLESLKMIKEQSSISILADEAVFTLADVKKVVSTKSADMINIKLMKCGGVSRAIEILEYAREHNVLCMLGSMLEGPHSINAALYLAFNYRDVIKYVDLDSPLLYKTPSDALDFIYDGAIISPRFSMPQ